MQIKRLVAGLCAFAMLVPVVVQAKTMEFTMGSQDVYVSDNGIEKKWVETAPFTENDRTLVPVRIIGECFGATVGWEETTQTVTIDDGATHITLQLGSKEAIVNGETKYLDVAAKELNGRTVVPLRFISENLGKDVEYVELTEQILITDEEPLMTINGYDYNIEDFRFLWTFMGYDAVEDAYKADLVQNVCDVYTKMEVLGVAAKANGYQLSPAEKDDVVLGIQEGADALYQSCLTAPGIKLFEKLYLSNAYLENESAKEYTTEELEAIYEAEYVCAKHILISTEGLTEEEAAEKKALAEDVHKQLLKGADFDELCTAYGEDPGVESNPDGYVFTKGEMVTNFEKAAMALEVGDISDVVETEYGYHIIKREALPELAGSMYDILSARESEQQAEKFYQDMKNKAEIVMHKTAKEIADML